MNGDGSDVYEDAFRRIAVSSDGTFHPTLVLLGVRLGIDRVTPVYWEALKAILQMKQSVGIAGYPLTIWLAIYTFANIFIAGEQEHLTIL